MRKWPETKKCTQTERELLASMRSRRNDSSPRVCKYPECPESMGYIPQDVMMFYKKKLKCLLHRECLCTPRYKIDAICNTCRKFVNSESRRRRAEKNSQNGVAPKGPIGSKQFKKDARICTVHHGKPMRECGCETWARYRKSKAHKAAISRSMKAARKANTGWGLAVGNRGNRGRVFTQAHKDKIANAQRKRWKGAKRGTNRSI